MCGFLENDIIVAWPENLRGSIKHAFAEDNYPKKL